MPMTAQNGAHGCDCGKVKVTLLNKRNAAEALTAPLNSEFLQAISGRKFSEMWAVMGGNSWTRFKLSTLDYSIPFCEK